MAADHSLNANANIRVNQAKYAQFLAVCAAAGTDASSVLRSAMDDVIAHGITFDPQTGKPLINRDRS